MRRVFVDGRSGTTGLRIYERLQNRADLSFIVLSEEERKDPRRRKEALNECDAAFLCLPDAAAIEALEMVENDSVIILDTSTAHRTHPGWAYGFPELSEKHRQAVCSGKRIAVPGCHASGFVALVYPLVEAGILPADTLVTCFSLTGYSGGGKKMIAQYDDDQRATALDSPRQYALGQTHKHLKEMKAITGLESAPCFSPIVADYYSGMQVTVPLFASQLKGSAEEIKAVYAAKYQGPVVRYCEEIPADGFAAANSMSGLDGMNITVCGNDERLLLVASFDNLGKGASGAAIQCMNLAFGLEQTQGLTL